MGEVYKSSFEDFYIRGKGILDEARARVYHAVNFEMVRAYWNIGTTIVEEDQRGESRSEYGECLVENLSARLSSEYGRGYDRTNVWNMIRFYRMFPKLDALRQELSWTHYRHLMRVENDNARVFYMDEAVRGNRSTRQLDRQIRSS